MNKLKKNRLRNKMSFIDLSKKSGVNASYICKLERGVNKNPSLIICLKLAKALNTSIEELFLN
ncbi:helix-turn-helix domain-containing protein [Clostridium sporogenes]|uniref:helix-turn-helix domain-containing protein n=1 Tax=Clostridium sporogenes TaxID=1509 RepID=UPI00024BA9C8|nr:helix-turn-helix transcriptional regulator [Clostridium sporogenes]EHN13110.1 hypothetical protein IYC_20626 [Clostridium sporogenes PA 3679]MDU4597904.1 helix-turn-helix transcriptional regulator [Clostridium sporogenes]NFQ35078.1 helix-turn-helix transcriptional regulator [Clostridium sporogenes]NFQ60906.1 helix-turn-helix transcriptional regulator [Clostridium sporogenes]NFU11249.1 helix-turn-helix transcriptional regulator [Clostridium sporogenes]